MAYTVRRVSGLSGVSPRRVLEIFWARRRRLNPGWHMDALTMK
jgi:hypothetical protein